MRKQKIVTEKLIERRNQLVDPARIEADKQYYILYLKNGDLLKQTKWIDTAPDGTEIRAPRLAKGSALLKASSPILERAIIANEALGIMMFLLFEGILIVEKDTAEEFIPYLLS